MRLLLIGSITSLSVLATGCASIVNGQHQPVSVETRTDAGTLSGAACKLSNNKGVWYLTSPGTTVVQRSYEDLAVSCEKEGTSPGLVSAKSSTKAMAFGNILFGGVIGAGVDIASGAAYDYPGMITVEMGKTMKIGAPAPAAQAGSDGGQPVAQPAAPAAAPAPSAASAPSASVAAPAPVQQAAAR